MEPLSDLWPRSSLSFLYRELTIDGVLLSHAHLDHSGYISFLREGASRLPLTDKYREHKIRANDSEE